MRCCVVLVIVESCAMLCQVLCYIWCECHVVEVEVEVVTWLWLVLVFDVALCILAVYV